MSVDRGSTCWKREEKASYINAASAPAQSPWRNGVRQEVRGCQLRMLPWRNYGLLLPLESESQDLRTINIASTAPGLGKWATYLEETASHFEGPHATTLGLGRSVDCARALSICPQARSQSSTPAPGHDQRDMEGCKQGFASLEFPESGRGTRVCPV